MVGALRMRSGSSVPRKSLDAIGSDAIHHRADRLRLVYPLPLPDESIRGHLGRIRTLNGWRSLTEVYEITRAKLAPTVMKGKASSIYPVIAIASGISSEKYFCDHSLQPLHRAVSSDEVLHGSPTKPKLLNNTGAKSMRTHSYFCESCVEEDLAGPGFSYWRREHQVPNRMKCRAHATNLLYMTEPNAMNYQPRNWLKKATACVDAKRPVPSDSFLKSYLSVMDFFLGRDRPMLKTELMSRMGPAFNSLDLRSIGPERGYRLSDLAAARLPKAWLKKNFPGFDSKIKGHFFRALDAVVGGTMNGSASSYAVTIALIYTDPEIAAAHLLANEFTSDDERKLERLVDASASVAHTNFKPRRWGYFDPLPDP
jgi:hypothetical protein